ncbi:MAG: hypothetical protein MESAZ_00423 [Saezia sanguinis]
MPAQDGAIVDVNIACDLRVGVGTAAPDNQRTLLDLCGAGIGVDTGENKRTAAGFGQGLSIPAEFVGEWIGVVGQIRTQRECFPIGNFKSAVGALRVDVAPHQVKLGNDFAVGVIYTS